MISVSQMNKTFDTCVEEAKADIEDIVKDYLENNPHPDTFPDFYDELNHDGGIDESANGIVEFLDGQALTNIFHNGEFELGDYYREAERLIEEDDIDNSVRKRFALAEYLGGVSLERYEELRSEWEGERKQELTKPEQVIDIPEGEKL